MENLYDAWLQSEDSYYEARFYEPIIEEFCQFHGGSADGRMGKGKVFNAGYEVFIYAFYIGLYYGERMPLEGERRKFRMPMANWGRKTTEKGRTSYTILQNYIFMALIAKSDIDLIELDKGCIEIKDACKVLMKTLNEYANMGFHLIENELRRNPNGFFENDGLLKFIQNFCPAN